jgi:hypothetical protein
MKVLKSKFYIVSISTICQLILCISHSFGQAQIVVSGPSSSCDPTGTYTISPPGNGVNVIWTSIDRNGNTTTSQGNNLSSFLLSFNNSVNAFLVTASYNLNGVTYSGNYTTYSCCDIGPQWRYLENTNSTALLSLLGQSTNLSNYNFVIRGTSLLIAQSFSITVLFA